MRYLFLFPLIFSLCIAQTSKRISQDMEVMDEILHELFQASFDAGSMRFRLESAPPSYQEGFGMVFYAPPAYQVTGVEFFVNDKDKNSLPSVIKTEEEVAPSDTMERYIISTARFFLQQYGDLAGELSDDDKIMVVYDRSNKHNALTFYRGKVRFPASGASSIYHGHITASARMGDIRAYRQGKLSKAEFQALVEVHREQQEARNQLEYRVFGKILSSRIFDLEKASREDFQLDEGEYFSFPATKVDMKLLEGLGVTYTVYWAGKYGNSFKVVTRGRGRNADRARLELNEYGEQKAQEDTDKIIEKIKEEVPEIMFAYGRTLRDLEDSELLTVEVVVPDCPNCSEKSKIIFRVKGSVMRAYDRSELSLSDAKKAIQMSEKEAD